MTLGFVAVNVLNIGIFCISASILTLWSLSIPRLSKFLSDVISSRQSGCEIPILQRMLVGERLCAKVKTSCHRSEYKA
jgi:hypothetical protein